MKHGPEFRKSETKERPFLRYGVFALGSLTGFIIALALLLINDIVESPTTKNQIIDNMPQIVTLAITFTMVWIASSALREQKKMRQDSVAPVLISHLSQDTNERSFIRLHISNVGAGAAMNVRAKISDVKNIEDKDQMLNLVKYSVLNDKKTLPVILKNDTVSYLMGRCDELCVKPTLEPFTIDLKYQDIEGFHHTSTHHLDIASFEDIEDSHTVQEKILGELKNIAEVLKSKNS